MPWDFDAKDLINAAKEDVNCYGGPGTGRGEKPKTGNSPRPDMRGAAKSHKYDPDTDFGM